jgi:uridine phosphorylase
METSAIYGLGKLMGHNCLAINAIVANRITKEFSRDAPATIEKLILKFLEIFSESI